MGSEPPGSAATPPEHDVDTLHESSVAGRVMRGSLQQRLFGLAASPTILGRFHLLEILGKGGMGVVYKAYDPQLDRKVAVKVLSIAGDEARARLVREAKALARLNHPNVVTIHEVDEDRGELFVAMEYVDGGTLESWCRAHPVEAGSGSVDRARAVLRFADQAVEGLAAAHELGIVHRDIKPANLLIGADDRLRIADFGLARPAGAERPAQPVGDASLATVSTSGAAVGTPAYMSPEQFRGRADAKSDQFGFCASFFEALYGTRPFAGGSVTELMESIERGRIEPVGARGVPEHVRRVLVRGLDPDPQRRFADMRALAGALRAGDLRRRRVRGFAVAAVACTVIAGSIFATRSPECTDERARIEASAGTEARARVHAAIVAAGRPYPEELTSRVDVGLDDLVERWSSQRLLACRAAAEPDPALARLATARLACLDDALRTVDATLAGLDTLTVAEANSLPDTLGMLLDVADCDHADPEAYGSELGLELIARHREGRLAMRAPDFAAAREAFAEVLARTEPDRLPSLRAGAYLELAAIDEAHDDREGAFAHATRALDAAERSGDPELLAMGWLALVQVAPTDVGDPMFEVVTARVHALLRDREISPHVRAQLAMGEAAVRFGRGDHRRAAALTREAIAIAEPFEHTYLAEMHTMLAGALQLEGDLAGALAAAQAAVSSTSDRLGAHHPELGGMLLRLGDAQSWACDDEAAVATCTRAIELLEGTPGYLSANLVAAYNQRASSLAAMQRFDEAIADLRHALALATADPDANGLSAALSHVELAHVYRRTARAADALVEADTALSQLRADDWYTLSIVADVRLLRAGLLVELGRPAEGRAVLEQVRPELDRVFPPPSTQHMQAIADVADVHVALHEPDEAQRELARYLDDGGSQDPTWTGFLQAARARAHREAGAHDEARVWAERAIATMRESACGEHEIAGVRALIDGLDAPHRGR
jgi:tetratricopeptide (TPR) repeat protein/predicted Ser/Thr protein kinase